MSCEFEERCYNANEECDGCMYNDCPNSLDYFDWNEEGVKPTDEEKEKHFLNIGKDAVDSCIFKEVCFNSPLGDDKCDSCMYNPDATTMNYFDWNGEGDEPTEEELAEVSDSILQDGVKF